MFQAALRYLTSGRPPWGREQDDALQETKSEKKYILGKLCLGNNSFEHSKIFPFLVKHIVLTLTKYE